MDKTFVIEVKAAEGGADAKLLVNDMVSAYTVKASLECL